MILDLKSRGSLSIPAVPSKHLQAKATTQATLSIFWTIVWLITHVRLPSMIQNVMESAANGVWDSTL